MYGLPSSLTQAGDIIDHAGAVPKPMMPSAYAIPESATLSSSSSPQRCRPCAIPEPTMPSTLRRPWPHNIVILPKPVMPSSLRCPQARNIIVLPSPRCRHSHDVPESAMLSSSSSPHHPRARNATLYIFLCHFGHTNLEFDMLHCDIALMCYTLLHCFCFAALL
jgi:hypothetical protein